MQARPEHPGWHLSCGIREHRHRGRKEAERCLKLQRANYYDALHDWDNNNNFDSLFYECQLESDKTYKFIAMFKSIAECKDGIDYGSQA